MIDNIDDILVPSGTMIIKCHINKVSQKSLRTCRGQQVLGLFCQKQILSKIKAMEFWKNKCTNCP